MVPERGKLLSRRSRGTDDGSVKLWEMPEEFRSPLPVAFVSKLDAQVPLRCLALRPDGKRACTLIPPAFGLAGVNLHTWTGFGSANPSPPSACALTPL